MPRKPALRANSVRRRVSSSFQAVPYRKRGNRTPSITRIRSCIDSSASRSGVAPQQGGRTLEGSALQGGIQGDLGLQELGDGAAGLRLVGELLESRLVRPGDPGLQGQVDG